MEATAQRGDEGGGLRGPAAVSRHRPPGVIVAPRPCREHRAGGLEAGLSQGCAVQGLIHVKGRAQSKEWDLVIVVAITTIVTQLVSSGNSSL